MFVIEVDLIFILFKSYIMNEKAFITSVNKLQYMASVGSGYQDQKGAKVLLTITSGVTRVVIWGEGCIIICSCSARLISFGMNLKTTDHDFKRNSSGRTRINI